MKILKLLCLIIVLLGLMPASSAWARGGHDGGHHFGGHHFGGHHYGGYGFGWELGLGYYGLGYGRYWPYYGGYSPYHGSYGGGYGGIQRSSSSVCSTAGRRKQLQNHKPTIGTIVVTQKVIIRMSKIAQMAGCKLSLSYHLHNKEKKKRYKGNH